MEKSSFYIKIINKILSIILFFVSISFFCLNLSAMIIDNLNDKRANWSAISDQVMGGISEVNFYEIEEDGKKFYRLEGLSLIHI